MPFCVFRNNIIFLTISPLCITYNLILLVCMFLWCTNCNKTINRIRNDNMSFLWKEFFDFYRSLPSRADIKLSDYTVTDVQNYFLSLSASPSDYLYLYIVATLQYISTIIPIQYILILYNIIVVRLYLSRTIIGR